MHSAPARKTGAIRRTRRRPTRSRKRRSLSHSAHAARRRAPSTRCPREDGVGRNVQGVLHQGRHPVEQAVERRVLGQRRPGQRGEPVEHGHEKERQGDVHLARRHSRAARCQCGKTHRSSLKKNRIRKELRIANFISSHFRCLPLNLAPIARVRAHQYLPPARAAARRRRPQDRGRAWGCRDP